VSVGGLLVQPDVRTLPFVFVHSLILRTHEASQPIRIDGRISGPKASSP